VRRYYDYEALLTDLQASIESTLEKHDLQGFHPLVVCALLEIVASPLKFHKWQGTPLTRPVGEAGLETYLRSRLACEVEQLKSPHSVIVNPLMDAVAAAIKKRSSLPPDELLRDVLRVYLGKPRLTHAGVPTELAKDSSIEPAIQSALAYLQEGQVIGKADDGNAWELAGGAAF